MDPYAIPYILFTVGMYVYIYIWFNDHIKRGEKKEWVWDELAKAKQLLEPLPPVVWQDIEDVAKATPEYKAWKKKHDAKYSAQRSERNKWSMDFTELKKGLEQKNCKHKYDHGSDWLWNVCTECGYTKKWYYTYACTCESELFIAYGRDEHRLIRRNPLCSEHGRPIDKYQEQRYDFHKANMFAKGGMVTPKEYT